MREHMEAHLLSAVLYSSANMSEGRRRRKEREGGSQYHRMYYNSQDWVPPGQVGTPTGPSPLYVPLDLAIHCLDVIKMITKKREKE